MHAIIYALFEPGADEVRYVGKTEKPALARLFQHLAEAQESASSERPFHVWLRGLVAAGTVPGITILDEVPDGENWEDYEQGWIHHYRGPRLLNETDGGVGLRNPSQRVRDAIAAKVSAIKLGNQHRLGIPHSDLVRLSISEAQWARSPRRATRSENARRQGRRSLGAHWANDGSKNIWLKPGDPLPDGFSYGRLRTAQQLQALLARSAGAYWVNNGETNRMLRPGEDVPEGYRPGRAVPPKGHHTVGARRRMSLASHNADNADVRVRNRRWITDGAQSRRLPEGHPLPDGWTYGRPRM